MLTTLLVSGCGESEKYQQMEQELTTEKTEKMVEEEKKENKETKQRVSSTPYELEIQADLNEVFQEDVNDVVVGEDYQYQYALDGGSLTQKVENGYYHLNNNIIYYIDEETMKANPICCKPNCLHGEEASEKRIQKCSAYTTSYQIQYYQGSIYIAESVLDENDKNYTVFYKIAKDGASKEEIFRMKNVSFGSWALHRGYIYYTTSQYYPEFNEVDPGEVQAYCKLNRISVSGKGEPETLYECKEVEYNGQIYQPFLYGNHVYVAFFGTREDRSADSLEDQKKLCVEKMLHYDIADGTSNYIEVDEDSIVAKLNIYRGKLLFYGYYYAYDDERNCQYYVSDLDGSNMQKIFRTGKPTDRYVTDGKYLYCDNYFEILYASAKEDVPQTIQVYDKNLKGIDIVELDYSERPDAWYVCGSDSKYFFEAESFLDEESVIKQGDILYFDKSEIGTIKGKVWNAKKCK